MSAPVPAMPPVGALFRASVRMTPLRNLRTSSYYAQSAYCIAQALAASDGRRRRVLKGADGMWHVEHARLGREVLR